MLCLTTRWLFRSPVAAALCSASISALLMQNRALGQSAPRDDNESRAVQWVETVRGGNVERAKEKAGAPVILVRLGPDAPVSELGRLAAFKHLRILVASYTKLSDKDVPTLARFPKLEELFLANTRVTGAGIHNLAKSNLSTNLKVLHLGGAPIDNSALVDIGTFSALESLFLDATAISDDGLKGLVKLRKLKSIDLRLTKVTDAGLIELARLPTLDEINLSGTNVTSDGLKALAAGLRNVPFVHFYAGQVTDGVLQQLHQKKSLHRLNLASEIGERPAGPDAVTRLNLMRAPVTDEGLKNLVDLVNLKHLILAGSNVTSDGLKHLVNIKNLEWLDLAACRIGDENLNELAKLKRLKRLSIGHSLITDRGVIQISKVESLEILDVPWNRVTDKAMPQLAKLKNLRELNLVGTFVSPKGIESFQASVPECRIHSPNNRIIPARHLD